MPDNNYKKLAVRLAGALNQAGVCPQCGNKNDNHMVSCTKVFDELKNPREVEKFFDRAFS